MKKKETDAKKAARAKYYALHKEEIKARTKKARSTAEGKTRRNALEKAARAAQSTEQKAKRVAVSNAARAKRLKTNKEFAESFLRRARENMRKLRKDDEYKTKNRIYQREWKKAKNQLKALNAEYDAFISRIENEALFETVNQIITKKSKRAKDNAS